MDRKARYNPTKSLTALTSQLTQEYEDRFLVELIQNAYDAHAPGTRDGRVHVLLDEANEEPVLYVANSGRPFGSRNFDALTNVAQSSKPPGEGIGNKGVGFRSVLQVCDSPEIFSCDADAPDGQGFDGFCFGFATDAQIRDMVTSDDEYDIVKRDFSRYLLPVLADTADPRLAAFWSLKMVTVIRLPLATERAVALARGQVGRLLEPTAPIALFLDRLASITVEHVEPDGSGEPQHVERRPKRIAGPESAPALHWVETVGRRFLTTTRTLTATAVRAVVEEAVAVGELDETWAKWDSGVEVSLAVPIDEEPSSETWPSTYTYLPMRVPSPVYAHLHAPFHTKLARLDLNEDSVFNAFMIRTAADLAAETIELLASDADLELETHHRRAAAADLLSWDAAHMRHIQDALQGLDLDLGTSSIVPVQGPSGARWSSLSESRVWPAADLGLLTPDVIQKYAPVVDDALGSLRTSRLNAIARSALSRGLEPSDDEVGGWVESIAKDLEGASLAKWNRFLADVAEVFDGRQTTALHGRWILLDDNRKLRRAGPWNVGDTSANDPTVFIPPLPTGLTDTDDGEDLSTVPKNLKRAITFLHEGIRVRTRVGASYQRTPVGELLKNADLVEPFELAAVLGHLERLLAGRVSDTTYRQALRWVYAQERASRANVADLARVGLHVPTSAGWIRATEAVFSPGWATPRAEAVAALVQESGGVSSTLRTLGTRVIASPDRWPFRINDPDPFREFLVRCGVRDGLFPVTLRSRTAIRMNGISFSPEAVATRFGLLDCELWDAHVREIWYGDFEGPYTPYTGQQHLWVVPGQDAFDQLGTQAKDRLAAAVLESLADWPSDTASYVFNRRSPQHRQKPDPQRWPSPARTFVDKVAWFPMSDPGRRDDRYFVEVANGWTFDETASEVAPRFARLAPIDHRRTLAASPPARTRLEKAGLNTWNSPASAQARLIEVAALIASGDVVAPEIPSLRRAASRAWSELADDASAPFTRGWSLIASRGQVLGLVEPDPDHHVDVFVHDTSPGLVAQVLEAGDFPILVADPANGLQIIGLLADVAGVRARGTSTVDAKVVLDGTELDAGDATGDLLLAQFGSWLVRTLLAIVDLRSSRFVRITNKVLHDAEARLRRMRLAVGSNIALVVDGRTLPATGRLAESVHLNNPSAPLLVLNGTDVPVPSWRALEILAEDLSELMGQAQAASEIRAAALALQQSVGDWREPSDAELARALRCNVESVTEVLHNLRTSTDHLRVLVAPFVGVIGGIDAARIIESEQVDDAEQLRVLAANAVGDADADAIFLAADRAESIGEMRRALGTPLADLNAVLIGLGRDRVTFPELHLAAVSNYIDGHRIELLDDLRRRFVNRYDQRGDLSEYVKSREFTKLGPDPHWLPDYEVPTEAMLSERASAWLAARGDRPEAPRALNPIDEVRAGNQAIVARELPKAAEVMRAWVTKRGEELPEPWVDLQQLRDQLGASGALDFLVLATSDLLSWVARLGAWPADMPLTLDAAALGLSAADIDAGKATGSESERQRRKRRTELDFGDRTYDTASDDLGDFVDAINASVTSDFLLVRPTITKLSDIPPRRPGGGGKTSGGGQPKPRQGGKPTDEVTAAIGLAGEILAYRWLQATYPETTPDSWVSRNRRFSLGGQTGEDTLGYDFRVARKNETLLFEVKTTKTDEYAFDIGESELRAARATRKGWYRIIFIRSVLTPDERELLVLPHPLDPSYAQVNQGLRLRFDPIGRARPE